MKKLLVIWLTLVILFSAGCTGDISDILDQAKDVVSSINVTTTSGLDQNTLDRVDDINDTLATGIEIGPETRGTIEELNETLANGLKAGFDEETLARVDELLRVVEDGLKIGLDDETLATIDGMVGTIDAMPGNWEKAGLDIIQTLENTAGSTAKTLADQVKGVINEARSNYQQMIAITGVEFRCNVDFMGSKTGSTAQEFIGKSIVGKIKNIISGKKGEETIPIPWVCQIMPDSLTLMKVGQRLVATEGVITMTGYNYVSANAPTAKIVDETGAVVPGINLYPYLSSPYQIQLNLQDLDLSSVPPRSRIVLSWPNIAETSGIALLMPGYAGPIASFSADKTSGQAPLTVRFTDTSVGEPSEWIWIFGDGSTSHDQNPVHEFKTSRDFLVQLTVKNALGDSSVIQTITVGTALEADFSMSKTSGDIGQEVKFTDKSKGAPKTWRWDFGDGSPTSDEQNPVHVYTKPNPNGYQVTLTVTGDSGTSTKTSADRVKIFETVEARFSMDKSSGKPPFTVNFTDESLGAESITAWVWDFGDGAKAYTRNASHQYKQEGQFNVILTVSRGDGSSDTETKTVNAYKFNSAMFRTVFNLKNAFSQNSVYFTKYFKGTGGTPVETGISASKYICGVVGFEAKNGVMSFMRTTNGSLRIYTEQYAGKWRIIAEFENLDLSNFGYAKESWNVQLMCYDRAIEGSIFTYSEQFRNIPGGTPLETGLTNEDYYSCGIVGTAGLAVTGFRYGYPNNPFEPYYSPIGLDQTFELDDGEWVLHTDMDIYDGGDVWVPRVLCVKQGSYLNVQDPPVVTERVYVYTSSGNSAPSKIGTADYYCGVTGYRAERVKLYAIHPLYPIDIRNVAAELLVVKAFQKDGYWWVYANIADRNQPEDWTVDLTCVRRNYIVEGTPPN